MRLTKAMFIGIGTGLITLSAAGKSKVIDAEMSGESYLGLIGNKVDIVLNKERCSVKSTGTSGAEGEAPKKFKIVFSCGSRSQVLWDIEKPALDDFSFDDPGFKVLWAGDYDGDGKIDLKMELSPKYSCSRKVTLLSSKAKKSELVGVSGASNIVCGA